MTTNPERGMEPVALEAAWEAFQSTPITIFDDSEANERKCLTNAIRAYLNNCHPAPVGEMREADTFQIGDMVEIVPEEAGRDWLGEPPHYITGIDWHPKHGVTYTTSEVWPPRCEGRFVVGLTDEWQAVHLRRAALQQKDTNNG
jgi:hypothetical protein